MSLVTLSSGGLDSAVMSLLAHEEGIELFPLFIDYGQLGAEKEWDACRHIHERHGLPKPVRMELSGFGKTIPSGITNKKLRINEDAFLPGRNHLFILAGASYAYSVQASGVAIGLLNPDNRLFPDQNREFLLKCEEMIELSIGRKISVVAPLITFRKNDILEMARAKGIQDSYSCHAGGDKPCGVCVACIEISNAKEGK